MKNFYFSNYAVLPDFKLSAVQSDYENHAREEMHAHDFYELVIVEHGTGYHSFKNERYPIGPGDIFLIAPGQEHMYESIRNLTLVSIIFQPEILAPLFGDFKKMPGFQMLFNLSENLGSGRYKNLKLSLPSEQLPEVVKLVERLQIELREQLPGFEPAAKNIFAGLLIQLSRHCVISDKKLHANARLISEVIAYMEKHIDERITLATLSRRARMPDSTFRRIFTESLKTSPINYLLALRLQKAALLLRSGNLTVSEVAFRVGFNDSNYFSHQFRKFFQMTPLQYRKSRLESFRLPAMKSAAEQE